MIEEKRIIKNTNVRAKMLLLVGFLLSFLICFSYARGFVAVYAGAELSVAALCYIGCLKRYRMADGNSLIYAVSTVVLAWCAGVFSGDFKSTLLITVPLLMPIYISTLNIVYTGWTDFVPATIAAVVIIFVSINTGVFDVINSNSLGFLGFMGVSLGILWIKGAKRKVIPTAIVVLGFYYCLQSGSRNVAIVGLICACLLFLPRAFFQKRISYFVICLVVICYSVFSAGIMEWLFSKPKIYQLLEEYTSQYSKKAWDMLDRVLFLQSIQNKIAQRNILLKLFGTGTMGAHGHNMFYQCVLSFGYVGVVLIYAGFCRVFKMAYVLICNKHDDVALGCAIILWGMIILQGADVFLLGTEAYAIVPQVIIGIVQHRYNTYCKERSKC